MNPVMADLENWLLMIWDRARNFVEYILDGFDEFDEEEDRHFTLVLIAMLAVFIFVVCPLLYLVYLTRSSQY